MVRLKQDTKIGFILIRGLSRQASHWMDYEDNLKQLFPGCQVEYYEQPGFGEKSSNQYPLTISRVAKNFMHEFNSYDSQINWIPIGISLGGMIVMELLKYKQFKTGVIINSSVANLPVHKRIRPKAIKELLECFMIQEHKLRESKIFDITAKLAKKKDVLPKWIEIAIKSPIQKQVVIRQLFAASTFRLPTIKKPLLILASKADELCSYECSTYIYKHLPKASLELHNKAGHDLPLDAPDWCSQKISEFINK